MKIKALLIYLIVGSSSIYASAPFLTARGNVDPAPAENGRVEVASRGNVYEAIARGTNVSSRSLRSGLTESITRCPDGSLFKTYGLPEKINTKLREYNPEARSATANGVAESFEDYDGLEADWLPSDWSEQSLAGYIPGEPNLTWHATQAFGSFRPTHGKSQAYIQYSDNQQDEWLISPEFTAVGATRLYADVTVSLFSIYDPEFFDPATLEFSKRRLTASLAVKVYHDGFWEDIWNARDLAASLSDKDLYEIYSNPMPLTLRLPMTQFDGKRVKVAFVYSGVGGNSMAIDNIAVAVPNNMAVYHRPRGFFFEGLNEQYAADQNFAAIIGPAYSEATWRLAYTRDVESVEWSFPDPYILDEWNTSTEWQPAMRYPYCITYAPSLTAKSNGLAPLTYKYDIANDSEGIVKYGGGGVDMDNPSLVYGCGAYNWRCGLQAPLYADRRGAYIFGPTANGQFWENYGMHLLSVASLYESPEQPYWFDKFWIHAVDLDADADAEFKLRLWKITDEGYLEAEPFASSVIRASDIRKYESGNDTRYTLIFPFDPITVDYAMLVELTGYMDNPKVRNFSPLTQNAPHVDAESNGYIFYQAGNNVSVAPTSSVLSNFYCPFIFTMNATYPFLFSEKYEWALPDGGGEQTIPIASYYLPEGWSIDEDIPDWITTFETYDDFSGESEYESGLKIEAAPLGNETGRIWSFTLRVPGLSRKFRISQGDVSGIETVSTDRHPVAVFDLNGHLLDIDQEELPRGVYILKYDDCTTRKIIK